MSKLDEERRAVKARIQKLEGERTAVEGSLSRFPLMPHDGVTGEELQLISRREALSKEIATLVETYENLLLESSEVILLGLADDSRVIKRLTLWLVALTLVLSVGTVLDVLARLGLVK